jgi:hypothetical protein
VNALDARTGASRQLFRHGGGDLGNRFRNDRELHRTHFGRVVAAAQHQVDDRPDLGRDEPDDHVNAQRWNLRDGDERVGVDFDRSFTLAARRRGCRNRLFDQTAEHRSSGLQHAVRKLLNVRHRVIGPRLL